MLSCELLLLRQALSTSWQSDGPPAVQGPLLKTPVGNCTVFWKGSEKINPEKGSDWPVGIMCFTPGARVGSAPSEWTEWDYYRMGVGLSLKGCCLGETIMPGALTIPVCTRTHTHGYTHIHTYTHTLYLARRC